MIWIITLCFAIAIQSSHASRAKHKAKHFSHSSLLLEYLCSDVKSALKLLTFSLFIPSPLHSRFASRDDSKIWVFHGWKRFVFSGGWGRKKEGEREWNVFESMSPFAHPMKSFWFILLMMSVLKLIVHIYFWFFSAAHVTALSVMGDHKYYPSLGPHHSSPHNDGLVYFYPDLHLKGEIRDGKETLCNPRACISWYY